MVDGNHSIRSGHSACNSSNSGSNNNNRNVPITPQMVKPRLENHELFSPLSDDGNTGDASDEDDLFADSATTTSELFGQCSKYAPSKSRKSSSKATKMVGGPQQQRSAFQGSVLEEEDDESNSDVHKIMDVGDSPQDIRDVVRSSHDLDQVGYGDDYHDDEDESVARYPASAVNNPQFATSLSGFGFDDDVMANYQAMESRRAKAKGTPAFGIVDPRRSFHSTDASATHTLQPVAAVPIPFQSKRGKKSAKESGRRSTSSSQDSRDSAGVPLAPMLDLETLEQQKQDAIDEEDYLRAAQIKKQIDALQHSPEMAKIEQLESLKKLAVRQEDYVKAAELKAQIEELKGLRRSNRQHHVRSSLNAALDEATTAAPAADDNDDDDKSQNDHQSSKRQQQSLESFFGQQSEDEEILEELEQEEGVDYIEDDPVPIRANVDTFQQSLHSRDVSQHSCVDNFGFVMDDLDDVVPNLLPEGVHQSSSGKLPLPEEKAMNPDWYANIVSSVKKSNTIVVDTPAASQRRSRRTTRTTSGGGRSASRSRSRSRTRREKLRRSCKAKEENVVDQVANSGGQDRQESKSRRDGRRTGAPASPRETGESSGHARRRSRSRSRRERRKASTSPAVVTPKANPSPRHDQQPGKKDHDTTSPRRKSSIVPSSGKDSSPFALQSRKVPAPQNESPDEIRKRRSSSRKLLMENQTSPAKKDSSLQNAIHVRSPPPSEGGGSHQKRGAASFRRTPPPPAPFDSSPAANSIKSFASEGCHLNSSKSNAMSRRLHRQSSMDEYLCDENHASSNSNSRSKHSRRCSANARTQSVMDHSVFAVESTASNSSTKNNNHNSEASPGINSRPSFRRGDSGIHSSVSTPSTSSRGGGRRLSLLESPTGVDGMPLESPGSVTTASRSPMLCASSDSAKVPSKYRKEIQTTLARLERLKERSSRRQALAAVSGSPPTSK